MRHATLTTLLIPGIGTIEELKHAYRLGVRSVRIATHCTEADISKQHIAAARDLGMDTCGFLMMSHMIEPDALEPIPDWWPRPTSPESRAVRRLPQPVSPMLPLRSALLRCHPGRKSSDRGYRFVSIEC